MFSLSAPGLYEQFAFSLLIRIKRKQSLKEKEGERSFGLRPWQPHLNRNIFLITIIGNIEVRFNNMSAFVFLNVANEFILISILQEKCKLCREHMMY